MKESVMSSEHPSIISHVSIGTNQFEKSRAFYDAVLPTLNIVVIMEHPGAVAYGRQYPEFWLGVPHDGKPASVGNGFHMGFISANKAQVHAFYDAAIAAGAVCDGPPGPRPLYGEPYYGCFVRDLEGHKIEAAYWDAELSMKLYGH
jgi:catechol 2,3-dioxygenase-like lactoylglutathione lyase family enzyme